MLSLSPALPTSKLKYSDVLEDQIASGWLGVPPNHSLSSWNVMDCGYPLYAEKLASSQFVVAVVADVDALLADVLASLALVVAVDAEVEAEVDTEVAPEGELEHEDNHEGVREKILDLNMGEDIDTEPVILNNESSRNHIPNKPPGLNLYWI